MFFGGIDLDHLGKDEDEYLNTPVDLKRTKLQVGGDSGSTLKALYDELFKTTATFKVKRGGYYNANYKIEARDNSTLHDIIFDLLTTDRLPELSNTVYLKSSFDSRPKQNNSQNN